MATKIRLQRHGRKGYAYYHIVVADSRAPRDGKFIERLGSYNPNTNPAKIDLNFERSLYWITVGAQPTDTVKNILSNEGVLLKKHLLGGVKKGAFDQAAAEAKFEAWKSEKENALTKQIEKLKDSREENKKKKIESEKEKSKLRAEALAQKLAQAKLEEQEKLAAEQAKEATAEVAEPTETTEEAAGSEPTANADETVA